MQTRSMGWMMLASALAFGLAVSATTLIAIPSASAKTAKGEDPSSASTTALSKDDQAKLKEHNKLRSEIMRVKYPASKADVVAHVKGIKADDKKWFEETLPDRTFSSSDEVMSALGWETAPPEGTENADKPPADHVKSKKTSTGSKNVTP
jgi:hypothetical protein